MKAGNEWRREASYTTGIPEQSAMAYVSPEVGFLVFSDDSAAVWRVLPPGAAGAELSVARVREDDAAVNGIESVAYDPESRTILALSENANRVYELSVEVGEGGKVTLGAPRRIATVNPVARRRSKGYEGFSLLPAPVSPDCRKWVVLANEQRPRRVCFFHPDAWDAAGHARLPERAKPSFPDLSDLAFDSDGSLFLLTDEGCRFGEFTLRRRAGSAERAWELALVSVTDIAVDDLPLNGADRLQPEAMAFDGNGDLWIAAEANGLLLHYARERAPQDEVKPPDFGG